MLQQVAKLYCHVSGFQYEIGENLGEILEKEGEVRWLPGEGRRTVDWRCGGFRV